MRSERLCARVASSRFFPSSVGPVPSSMCRVAQMAPSPGPEPRPGPGRADQPDRLQSLSRRGTHLSRLSEPTTVTVVVCQGQPNTAHVGAIHLGRRGRSPRDARAAKLRGPAVIPIGIDPPLGDNASRDALHPATLQERSASSRWRRVVRASRRPPRPTSPSRLFRTFPLPVAPTRANVDGRRLPAAATTRRNPAHDGVTPLARPPSPVPRRDGPHISLACRAHQSECGRTPLARGGHHEEGPSP